MCSCLASLTALQPATQGGDARRLNPDMQNALPLNPHRVGSVWLERFADALEEEGPPSLSFEEWDALPSPRVIKTHALPSMLVGLAPGGEAGVGEAGVGDYGLPSGVRLLHVSRNARDAAISAYHHPSDGPAPAATGWPLDAFLALWVSEYHAHGSMARHACAWQAFLEAQSEGQVLRLLYEEMKRDPSRAVAAVARLLGVEPSEHLIESVVRASEFERMKAQARGAGHMRRGEVGSSADRLPAALADELDIAHAALAEQLSRSACVPTEAAEAAVVAEAAAKVTGKGRGGGGVGVGGGDGATKQAPSASADPVPDALLGCNFAVVDLEARRSQRPKQSEAALTVALAAELSAATAPVLIRGATRGWAAAQQWSTAEGFEALHGSMPLRVGRGTALALHGPAEALQLSWGAESLSVRDFARARRLETLSSDAYVFYDVEDSAFAAELSPLHRLWDATAEAQHGERRGASSGTQRALRPAVRLGLGGARSGVSFHLHGPALNANFYGRKRWWAYSSEMVPLLNASFLRAREGSDEPVDSHTFDREIFPSAAFQRAWTQQGATAWQCVQAAGELVYLPAWMRHATLNEVESLGVVLQLDAFAQSPLHLAAHRGDANAAEELLAAGAEPHSRSSSGLTPLHLAAFQGHAACVEALLRHPQPPPGEHSLEELSWHEGVPRRALLQMVAAFPDVLLPVLMPAVGEDFEEAQDCG